MEEAHLDDLAIAHGEAVEHARDDLADVDLVVGQVELAEPPGLTIGVARRRAVRDIEADGAMVRTSWVLRSLFS